MAKKFVFGSKKTAARSGGGSKPPFFASKSKTKTMPPPRTPKVPRRGTARPMPAAVSDNDIDDI